MNTWGRRKIVLLTMFTLSLILLGYSFYHSISRNHLLETGAVKSSRFIEQISGPDNGWAWSDTVFAFALLIVIFILLLREITAHRKMIEELKMQREHFSITISSIDEGLITTCRNGGILYMNPAAERLTGWHNDEAKNLPFEKIYNVINEETGKPIDHIVSRVLRHKKVVSTENNTLLLTRDKKKIIISNSGSPLFDSNGEISGAVLVFNDISEKKKIEIELRESEKQYRTSIKNLPRAVKEEEKTIAKAIIDAQEQERCFIGQELHDNVNQLLASSLLTLGEIKHYRANQEKVDEFVEITRSHIQDALNEIRNLSHELVPATFDGATLKNIFESLLLEINVKNQFVINFQFDEKINALVCADLQINLYRILQEQVKNILTYADAKTINLTVYCKGDVVVMRTVDNGIGFDSKKVKAGIGLNNMNRRVESFGGKFSIKSQPGKGCEIIIEIPTRKSRV